MELSLNRVEVGHEREMIGAGSLRECEVLGNSCCRKCQELMKIRLREVEGCKCDLLHLLQSRE